MNFLIINLFYLVLPFGFAATHNKINGQKIPFVRLALLYFLLVNVLLKGLPIGLSAIFQGQAMAIENDWGFSPIYAEYGIAVASMGLMGLFALMIEGGFRLAVTLTFGLFLFFSAISHIIQALHGVTFRSHNIIILTVFDFLTAIILFYFCLNKKSWR